MIKKIYIILLLSFLLINNSYSEENFFDEAKKLFNNEKYEESKFLFQRDIVFNPKKADSYLFLAKIFKIEEAARIHIDLFLSSKKSGEIGLINSILK